MSKKNKLYDYSMDDVVAYLKKLNVKKYKNRNSKSYSPNTSLNWNIFCRQILMIKRDTLVTIYITNYNYGKYLQKSIESVLNQTFKNFELIIIDDGSTDSSKSIISKFK